MHVRREARLVDDHRYGVELSLAPTPVKSSQKNRPDAPYEGLPPNRWMPRTNAKCPHTPDLGAADWHLCPSPERSRDLSCSPVEMVLRPGTVDDESSLLELFDEAVRWLAGKGLGGQWGTQPWSERPDRRERISRLARSSELTIAEVGDQVVGALEVSESSPSYAPQVHENNLYIYNAPHIPATHRARDRRSTLESCPSGLSYQRVGTFACGLLGWGRAAARQVLRVARVYCYRTVQPRRLAWTASDPAVG